MEIFTTIIEILFVLLILAGIYTIFKYPKDILVTLPLELLKSIGHRIYQFIAIITFPIWIPMYFLDKHYKWGIFSFFSKIDAFGTFQDDDEIPDIEYDVERELHIDFQRFDKYIITSANDLELEKVAVEGLHSVHADFDSVKLTNHKNLNINKVKGIDLYSFHYLVQWIQNKFNTSKTFWFAQSTDFSFFCTCDKKTLNNLIGETSDREIYSYSMTNPEERHLGINNSIEFKKRYTTNFFNNLIKNSLPSPISTKIRFALGAPTSCFNGCTKKPGPCRLLKNSSSPAV